MNEPESLLIIETHQILLDLEIHEDLPIMARSQLGVIIKKNS